MSKVILDAELLAKLGGLRGRVALYDQYGNLKAYVDPVPGAIPPELDFTPEEIAEAMTQTGPCKTLDEIIREAEAA